jgi:putative two-component system response regulator
LDGYKLLAILKSNPLTKDIPIIFLTDSTSLEEEELGFECGAADFLRKPIRGGVLRGRVRAHIESKRPRDEIKIQNHLLTIELDRRMREIAHVQNLSLDALTELAKVRDNETGEHLVRTQEYVRILAEWLMEKKHYSNLLDEQSISLMVRSAPLHDIGKVGIPDRILLKPGKLTPKEWQVKKLHPVRGYEALQLAELRSPVPIPHLRYAKEIARHHHEKWNGTGYPDGLVGEEIPLSARLMAVADVFDALISQRVYKPAWDISYSRECIINLSGVEFDPMIVKAFDARFDEILQVAEKRADQPASY